MRHKCNFCVYEISNDLLFFIPVNIIIVAINYNICKMVFE